VPNRPCFSEERKEMPKKKKVKEISDAFGEAVVHYYLNRYPSHRATKCLNLIGYEINEIEIIGLFNILKTEYKNLSRRI
jgi:hypothetical protein